MSQYPEVTELIPHRGEMLKLDRLANAQLEGGEVRLEGQFRIKEGDIFLRDGVLRESALVEIAAQTVAAGEGLQGLQKGLNEPPLGYLVGIEKFQFLRPVRVGETVYSEVKLINSTGPLRTMEAVLRVEGEVAARGILKLYRDETSDK